jgi:hypothetical protein
MKCEFSAHVRQGREVAYLAEAEALCHKQEDRGFDA